MRDTDNAAEFLHEFEEFERNVESPDPGKRLPNFRVMSRPEDHTAGTTLGRFNPIAMVANNDYAAGMIVDRITHSRYWPETAIFIIEDDAQDGADHVDARRNDRLYSQPYIRRQTIDGTPYTTEFHVAHDRPTYAPRAREEGAKPNSAREKDAIAGAGWFYSFPRKSL